MRLSLILFYFLIFFIPVNWGYHFISKNSYVQGILVDYLIPTLYFTDILVLIFVVSVFVWKLNKLFGYLRRQKLTFLLLGLFFIFMFLGSPYAVNKIAFWYKFVKLIEMSLLFVSVGLITEKVSFQLVKKTLFVSALFVSLLALFQFILQKSIFGYWFLGEPILDFHIPAIMKDYFSGHLKILPYGLFPHPNILGGYLSIVIVWVLGYSLKGKNRFELFSVLFLLSILFLTRSYSALASLVIGVSILFFRRRFLKFSLSFVAIVSIFFSLFPVIVGEVLPLSLQRRIGLIKVAFAMLDENFVFGVGLNNFIVRLPEFVTVREWIWFLQPVHNVYWLILVESGIFALLCFIGFIFHILLKLYKNLCSKLHNSAIGINILYANLIQVLMIFFIDHYWWTIQQGLLLFFILLGLSIGNINHGRIGSNAKL